MNTKIKIKFTTKNIFKGIFLFLIIANLILLFFIVNFIKDQVYDTMFITRDKLLEQSNLTVEDIDIDSFNEIIQKIDKKKSLGDIKVEKNIFQ